ncbi:hypothetical protein CANCADRAFT_30783 [Tortispora caseinolytica NRRL Y-17796]|uniref:Uncharacterized protein n=1 Tax=Tortispora caseinolytica NRRL Y-17796 TaxID=767744 RepID=A0A1E4TLR8_9ASCO|nr:hypothetical protein CANCADRAFT_30783 [Tortispora caseinolytica NRRL Y-17796]
MKLQNTILFTAGALAAQNPVNTNVWTSTLSNGQKQLETPTVVDAVVIHASPPSTTDPAVTTPWVSIDGSGIPTYIVPTIYTTTISDSSIVYSTASASPTTPSGYPTPSFSPPVLQCFPSNVPTEIRGDPFCAPLNGTEMLLGESYFFTWNPLVWGEGNDITRVRLKGRGLPLDANEDEIFNSGWISNNDGYYIFTVTSDMFTRSDFDGYFFLSITPQVPSDSNASNTATMSGPILRIIKSKSDAITTINRVPSDNTMPSVSGSSGSGKSKMSGGQIAAAVIVPVVVVAMAIAAFFYLRKHGGIKACISGRKGNGYMGSRTQRMSVAGGTLPASEVELGRSESRRSVENPF